MGGVDFLLGFVAGWIVTTDEGKKAASAVADKAVELAKEYANKNKEN